MTAACTSHHDTPCARAVSLTARPEVITAGTNAVRNRTVDLALAGTSMVDSANVPRTHSASSQNHRRLHHTTSSAPATGTSRIR